MSQDSRGQGWPRGNLWFVSGQGCSFAYVTIGISFSVYAVIDNYCVGFAKVLPSSAQTDLQPFVLPEATPFWDNPDPILPKFSSSCT